MTHRLRVLLATAALSLLRPSSAGDASCVPVTTNTFCTGVTWNVTIGLVPPADIDAQAKADYEQALSKLSRPGQPPASRACFAAWKGLNCARKFPRCLPGLHMDAVTTCQTLCEEFAHACNASELMLVSKGACASAQFDIPPCTDYIDPLPSGLSTMYSADWPPGGSPGTSSLTALMSELTSDVDGRRLKQHNKMATVDALMQLFKYAATFMTCMALLVFYIRMHEMYIKHFLDRHWPSCCRDDEPEQPEGPAEATTADNEEAGFICGKRGVQVEEIGQVLSGLKLQRYTRDFERAGYDDWAEIVAMDGAAFDTLASRVKLAPNHADRLKFHVKKCRSRERRGLAAKHDAEPDCVIL